jgi:hypothetical protein
MFRHNPFPVVAHFRRSLVLTFACPPAVAAPMLAPGLTLDTWQGHAFLAIAMVQTERLRPSFLPAALGRDFFLAGYRVFVRHGSQRGLQILRSDTDRRSMVRLGNMLTHYHYRLCRFELSRDNDATLWRVSTPNAAADLEVIETPPAGLPRGSVFGTEREARRFAGPLPMTFGYEPCANSLISVRGMRANWSPRLVTVDVRRSTWLPESARLASAFAVEDVAYRWDRGVRIRREAA